MNREIRAQKVRLIDEKGNQVGVVPLDRAQREARERGVDLVEVAPNANPPVCRMLDYGKYLYEKERRDRKARQAQKKASIKEIQLRPKIANHDFMVKVKRARRFIEEGAKVRVRLRFRGREITHQGVAQDLMDRMVEELKDVAFLDNRPSMEGYDMIMILAPGMEE
ncbi:MAG: translation initiation factor IF-3 [Anaerolineales bacterium]